MNVYIVFTTATYGLDMLLFGYIFATFRSVSSNVLRTFVLLVQSVITMAGNPIGSFSFDKRFRSGHYLATIKGNTRSLLLTEVQKCYIFLSKIFMRICRFPLRLIQTPYSWISGTPRSLLRTVNRLYRFLLERVTWSYRFLFTTVTRPYRFLLDTTKETRRKILKPFVYVLSVWAIIWYYMTYVFRSSPATKEARRWFRQAELDHQASQNDMNDDNPAYEWVCYKCQQATEKAVKAAMLSRRGPPHVSKSGHELLKLCKPLGDPILSELVGTLHNIIGVSSRMRYPDILPHPKVPHDVYSGQEASNAWEMTGQILQHIHQNYTI